jgi:RimJ/RimL family protein N-acetyltransferase
MSPDLASLPPITTARLLLRPLGIDDIDAFHRMTCEPSIIAAIDFLSAPFKREDAHSLILGRSDGRNCFWGVWPRDETTMIGTIGTHLHGAEIEIGYWFAAVARGRGFATEAVRAVVGRLSGACPDYPIVAECRPDNRASWALLERVGFVADGREGHREGRKRLVLRVG